MPNSVPPRILVVDDEEAILETMTFTFMDDYEVLTSTDARRALDMLDERAPVAVVITDQRMPEMTGVEFLSEVVERHPETARIMLTGFADMDSTVQAINDGHVYAYVNKPWEPDELKQVVKRAYDHHALSMENARLVADLQRANSFLEAVMDRLDTGALAIDSAGVVRAANRPAIEYLGLPQDPHGVSLEDVMSRKEIAAVRDAVKRLEAEEGGRFEEVELRVDSGASRVRISLDKLVDSTGATLGRVVLFREVSHEPLRRRFDESIASVGAQDGDLRPRLDQVLGELTELRADVEATGIVSKGMAELVDRTSRAQTAIQNWLDVDDLLAREDYPDAQLLQDRMRLASRRWPNREALPERVQELARRVESYYESGENSKQQVL